MIVRTITQAILIGGTLVAGACDTGVSAPEDSSDVSFLVAEFDGALNMQFNGIGRFHGGADPRRPAMPAHFSISSMGRGAQADQFIQFFRPGAALPQPGSYPLSAVTGASPDAFRVTYQQLDSRGATMESYVGITGQLEITESSAARVAGMFHFTGQRTCSRATTGSLNCTVLATPDPAAPKVNVTGSFVATPISGTDGGVRLP